MYGFPQQLPVPSPLPMTSPYQSGFPLSGIHLPAPGILKTPLVSTAAQAVGAVLTLPANTLDVNGRAYRATFSIDTNNAAADLTVQIRFNGTSVISYQDSAGAAQISATLTIIRISETQYRFSLVVVAPAWSNVPTQLAVATQTVTNWTSSINFDVNISEWTSGTINSMIIGEPIG